MDPKLFTIILNFNRKDDLNETILSFKSQNYRNNKIVVVDNGSEEDIIDFLSNSYPDIQIIKNHENLGWAGGNNIGIDFAFKNGADFILLANNDLYFDNPIILDELIATLESEQEIGLIGPVQNYYSNKGLKYTDGWNFSGKNGKIYNYKRSGIINVLDNVKIVDSVSGAFMLFKKSIVDRIGYIDENFFLYVEDADYALRVWSSGLKCAIRTDLTIYHKVSATAGDSPLKLYYKTRNLLYFIFKNKRNFKPFFSFFSRVLLSNIKLFTKILFKSKYEGRRNEFMKAFLLGWYHFFINRLNKVY